MINPATVSYFAPDFDFSDVERGKLDYCAHSVTYANLKNWFGRYRCNESFWLIPGTHAEAGVTFEAE